MIQELQSITADDCFGTAFELFGKVWPAFGPAIISLMLICIIGMARELWRAVR